MVSKDFLATFERNLPAGATDQRRALFYADDTVNMGRTDYFYGETCYILYAYQNVGFSTVENMLIAAECEARVGSKDNAMSYVNKLRDNRIKNNVALTATDKDEALRIVLDERRREFAFTGFHRLIDLKRLMKTNSKKPSPIRQTANPLPLHRTTIGTSSRLIK